MIAIIRALAFKIVHKVVRDVTVAFAGAKTLIIWTSFNAREGSELFVENIRELNAPQKSQFILVNTLCALTTVHHLILIAMRSVQESSKKTPRNARADQNV